MGTVSAFRVSGLCGGMGGWQILQCQWSVWRDGGMAGPSVSVVCVEGWGDGRSFSVSGLCGGMGDGRSFSVSGLCGGMEDDRAFSVSGLCGGMGGWQILQCQWSVWRDGG